MNQQNERSLYLFLVDHFIFPIMLLFLLWCASGFPISDAHRWQKLLTIFAVIYLPIKTMKILIHKDKGILRHSYIATYACFYGLFAIWVAATIYALFTIGIPALIGSVFVAYALYMLWGNISGEEGEI